LGGRDRSVSVKPDKKSGCGERRGGTRSGVQGRGGTRKNPAKKGTFPCNQKKKKDLALIGGAVEFSKRVRGGRAADRHGVTPKEGLLLWEGGRNRDMGELLV